MGGGVRMRVMRGAVVSMVLVMQLGLVAALVLVFYKFAPYFYLVSVAFSVLGVVTVLALISKNSNPNYIIPWIVIILLMPMAGTILYLFLSKNRLKRHKKRAYRQAQSQILQYVNSDKSVQDRLKEQNKAAFNDSQYLFSASKLPLHGGTDTQFLPTGESFFSSLMDSLRSANSFIFLEYFIIDNGEMLSKMLEVLRQKKAEGVEVRLMYDDLGSIGRVSSHFYKRLNKEGIRCVKFNRFLPIFSSTYNNRDHRKIAVIDGQTAFIGGANIADEYINLIEKHGHWKDSAIKITGSAVKSVTAMFLQMYSAQTGKSEDYSPYLTKTMPTDSVGYVQPFGDGPTPLYLQKVAQTAVQNMLNSAKDYVFITTPYLIVDFLTAEALRTAAKRGVDVRIVTPAIGDSKLIHMMTRSSYRDLIESGVSIYEYTPGFMHAKNFLADDTTAMVGSFNMDYRSFVHHFECGVWMQGTAAIAEIKADFIEIFAVSKRITLDESRLKAHQLAAKLLMSIFAPML